MKSSHVHAELTATDERIAENRIPAVITQVATLPDQAELDRAASPAAEEQNRKTENESYT